MDNDRTGRVQDEQPRASRGAEDRELSNANIIVQNSPVILYRCAASLPFR